MTTPAAAAAAATTITVIVTLLSRQLHPAVDNPHALLIGGTYLELIIYRKFKSYKRN